MTLHMGQQMPQGSVGPIPVPRRVRERRWRPLHVAAAAVMVVAGLLGGGVAVMTASAQDEYLALARDVEFGQQLTGSDLVTVRVGTPPGVEAVPAAQLEQVTGLHAAVPLVRGSLLAPAMLTGEAIPDGQHVVGITVRNDRLPTVAPQPGERVQLVATGQSDDAGDGGTWPALVTAVSSSEDRLLAPSGRSRSVTLDVAVPAEQAPDIARAAAAGELVVVRTGEGG